MVKKIKHIGLAVVVFAVIAGAFLWLTGTFAGSGGAAKDGHAHAGEKDPCGGHGDKCEDAHGEEAKPAVDSHEGHGHGENEHGQKDEHADANPDLDEIQKATCEHNMLQLDCDECRYELGVVKVQPSVTDALTKTAVVQQRELVHRLRLTGEVQYDQTTVMDVLPATPGKVVSVKARLGQKVAQGDVLAVIHSTELGEAKAAHLEAVAASDVAFKEKDRQAAVAAALEKLLAALAEGGPSADGAPAPLGEWRSRLVGAAARLQHAKSVFERENSLVSKQASSRAELEAAQLELRTAQAGYAALVEEVQLNLKLERLRFENAARLAETKLATSEQRLHLLGLDHEAIKSFSLKKENGTFAQLQVKAPRSGVVTALNVTEGKFIENSQSILSLADTSNVWVWCDLYDRDLRVLHDYMASGQKPKATVKVSAFPAAMAGSVDLIGSAIDETTRTVKVRVQVKNEQGALKPGMFAAVTVEIPTGKKVTMAPRQAVLNDEGKFFAFQHWKGDLWLKRNLVLGQTQDDLVEITAGLEPGAKVVYSGAFLFKSDILREKMGAGCAD